MINIREFEMTLKLTWIRKLIKEDPDWSEFAEIYHIRRLCQSDENYQKEILEKTKNDFWSSVAKLLPSESMSEVVY